MGGLIGRIIPFLSAEDVKIGDTLILSNDSDYEGNLTIYCGGNELTGNLNVIKASPSAASTATVLYLEADGSNWGSGARIIKLVADDTDAIPLHIENGSGTYITTGTNQTCKIVPNGSGITQIGDAGSTSQGLNTNDDLFVSGKLEVDGVIYVDAGMLVSGYVWCVDNKPLRFGSGNDTGLSWNTNQSPDSLVWGLGSDSNSILFCEDADISVDFGHAKQTNPTILIHSADATRLTEYSTDAYNNKSISGGFGSFCGLKSITEVVTIPVGSGFDPVVETTGNLAPANSLILGVCARVTDAPGGGATVLAVGITGGDADALIDDIGTALNTVGNSAADNDGTQLPLMNDAAATLTLTTDADVTGDEMKVRVTTFYIEFTEHTS